MSNKYASFIESLINRRRLLQPDGNGFVLALPAKEQTTAIEDQIRSILQNSSDDVILFDTEGKYLPLAEELNAQVIRPSIGQPIHINPFAILNWDKSIDCDDRLRTLREADLLCHKSDLLISLCEILVGGTYDLSPYQHFLIRTCVKSCYEPYFAHKAQNPNDSDPLLLPTMRDFYRHMRFQSGADAAWLADALQPVVLHTDTLNTTTNICHNKRFVVYDLQYYRGEMSAATTLLFLEHIWTKYIATRKASDNSPVCWIYLDDISSLLRHESTVLFISGLFRKSTAHQCILTGCAKSAEPFFRFESSKYWLSGCNYLQTQCLSPIDQEKLLSLLQIPISLREITRKAISDDYFIRLGNQYIESPKSSPETNQ